MPSQLEKLIHKAQNLQHQKKLPEALEVYKKVCKLDKNNPNAWLNYGSIAGNSGKLEIAESAFKKAYLLQNKTGPAATALAQVYELMGKYEDAINLLTAQHRLNPDNNDIKLKVALIYGKSQNFDKAIQWLNDYITIQSDSSYAHHCLANSYEQTGNTDKARHHFEKALELDTNSFQLYNSYGVFLQNTGNLDKALKCYLKAIDINKQYPIAIYNAALLYHLKGEYKTAIEYYNVSLAMDNKNIAALVGIGKSYLYSSATDKAIELYNKAIAIDANYSDAYANLGLAHVKAGCFTEGMMAYEKALEINPENVEILCAIATLHEREGNFTKAHGILKKLIDENSDDCNFALAYGKLSRNIDDAENAIKILKVASENPITPPLSKSEIHFLIGKLYNSQHDYDNAFINYKSANDLQPFTYNLEKDLHYRDEIISTFSNNNIKEKAINNSDNTPIFIVGMPRSGTTLVEQILASHPDVHGGGELTHISDLLNKIPGLIQTGKKPPLCVLDCDKNTLHSLSKEYIDLTRKLCSHTKHITDKMPHNFQLLGFIEILFPEAKIIHCTRNPIDTCLSIYFNSFNANHAYSRNLEQLASYYKNNYLEIMKHWKNTLTIPILNVKYEDLIANQEEISRKMIDHCHLQWNDDCLRFYETKRDVDTISYDQVRQPIYKNSCERWRNYENHIQPLIEQFTELV